MKPFLLFALLFLPFAALAQNETCPRVWRGGDSLLTDPAPQVQWLRDGQAIPGANERWLIPDEAGRYSVKAFSEKSPAYSFGSGYLLSGYVFDELHRPIEGATVRRGAFSAMTDEVGRFALQVNEVKPAEQTPVLVTVEKAGYWKRSLRQYVSAYNETETQVMLHTRRVTNWVDAKKGGEMAYRGFTLQLPPNAVQTESGTPYTGTILLSVEGALPSDPDFGLRIPGGDFSAIDADGNDVMLYSYGYLSAEMTSESGEKLELRPQARATLRFYLPWNETHRPDSVPLWHFDESRALWEQEGWSVRNGSIYEGQVSHFSSWNCDIPAERATCRGRVIDCNDEPVKGGWVRVGQRQVVTDSLGNYRTFVPGGVTFDAWASVDTLRGISVAAQDVRTLDDLAGRNFGGLAVWNPQTQSLTFNLTGNVPADLRLSIDGGQTWTQERQLTGIRQVPVRVLVEGACGERIRLYVMPKIEDCRSITRSQLDSVLWHDDWNEALSDSANVYKLRLSDFNPYFLRADYFAHFPCIARLDLFSNVIFWNSSLFWNSEVFTHLPHLKQLYMRLNHAISLPESFGNLVSLQSLYLHAAELRNLPESFGYLNNLSSLYIEAMRLSGLPENIGNLRDLQSLVIVTGALTSLPDGFGSLTNLQTCDIRFSPLARLPENIGNLTLLHKLTLEGNRIEALPESLGNLTQLQELNLERNRLEVLPEGIGNLTQLQMLNLERNQLASLPDGIGELRSLQELRLSSNQLTDLPASMTNLAATLRFLYLSGNPIPGNRRAAIHAMLPNTLIIW